VTVDLGRPRRLEGFGVSLSGDAASARVTIEAGRQRFAATVPVGTPAWLRRDATARTIRLWTDGACVAELRAMGPGPHAIIGHDLSFAVQEAAAGATYTDRGRAKLPERILADHGADWVRLRLWVDPPAGYSDLPGVLAMARRAKAAAMRLLLDPHLPSWSICAGVPCADSASSTSRV
jgi:Glycosyl hydrolase family 53